MKIEQKRLNFAIYRSEVMPEIFTKEKALSHRIQWADENPIVYKILTEKRSKTFGSNSVNWYGYDRGDSAEAVIRRIASYKEQLSSYHPFFHYVTNFTFNHYLDEGFCSGYIQQWDGKYTRQSARVDFTPKSLPELIQKFKEWCDSGPVPFHTQEIWMNGNPVWTGCPHPSKTANRETGELRCDSCKMLF